eukprot:9484756-Pyramimonas_sp.AAC.2
MGTDILELSYHSHSKFGLRHAAFCCGSSKCLVEDTPSDTPETPRNGDARRQDVYAGDVY